MARKGRSLGRAETRDLHRKIVASREATIARQRAEELHRLSCPIEAAKNVLRRKGFHVFNQNVFPEHSRSDLIVVGCSAITVSEMIAKAARYST